MEQADTRQGTRDAGETAYPPYGILEGRGKWAFDLALIAGCVWILRHDALAGLVLLAFIVLGATLSDNGLLPLSCLARRGDLRAYYGTHIFRLIGTCVVLLLCVSAYWACARMIAGYALIHGDLSKARRHYAALAPFGPRYTFRSRFLEHTLYSSALQSSDSRLALEAVRCTWGEQRKYSFHETPVAVELVVRNVGGTPVRVSSRSFLLISRHHCARWCRGDPQTVVVAPGQSVRASVPFDLFRESPDSVLYFDGRSLLASAMTTCTAKLPQQRTTDVFPAHPSLGVF